MSGPWEDYAHLDGPWHDYVAAAQPDTVTPAEYTADILRKFKQGASLGFGDEASGALKATFGGRGAEGATWGERYQHARDYERAAQEKASKDAPVSSFLAEMAGSVAPSIAAGGIAGLAGGAGRVAATTTLPAVRTAALPVARAAAPAIGNAIGTGAIVGGVQGVGDTTDIGQIPLAAVRGGALGMAGGAAGYGLGKVAQKAANLTNTSPRVAPAPTTDEVKAAAQAAYDRFQNAGGLYTQGGINDLAQRAQQVLTDANWQPELAPGISGFNRAMHRLQVGSGVPHGAGNLPQTATPAQIQNIRRVATGLRDSAGANNYQRNLGSQLAGEVDNFLETADPSHYASPPGGATSDQLADDLKEANRLWSQYSKADTVDEALSRAQLRAASTYSGGNENNAMRQELRRIYEKRKGRWTPDEDAAFQTAIRGGKVENIARMLGKLAPSRGGLSTWANIGAGAGTGGATLPLTALAEGAKVIGDRATKRNLEEVSRVIRAGGSRTPAAPPPNALQRLSEMFPQLFSGPAAQGFEGLLGR
jgi:hypothetical protein